MHGIEEEKDEVTDDGIVNILQDKFEPEILKKDIDRSHRVGKPSPRKKRPIIMKFVRYSDRHKAYSNKNILKGSGISITESLPAYRMGESNKTRDEHGFRNVWTHNGKILFKENGSSSTKLLYG